jgi:hypothetical protein
MQAHHTGSSIKVKLALLAALAIPMLATAQPFDPPLQTVNGTPTGAPNGAYAPPPCKGLFSDVPCSPTKYPGVDWIEQLAGDGITQGCATSLYCPAQPVTRAQMAIFLERMGRGTANWPPHVLTVYHRPYGETNSDLQSGADLLAQVATIPTSGPEAPSIGHRWVIKVGPGTFDLGSGTLYLSSFVSLEGAGQDETLLTSSASDAGTVHMNGLGTVRSLEIASYGSGANQVALGVDDSSTVLVDSCVLQSQGGTSYNIGLYISRSSSVTVQNNSIISGLVSGAPGVHGVGIYAGTNTSGTDAFVFVRGSKISGGTNVIVSDEIGMFDIRYSQLDGGPVSIPSNATITCLWSADWLGVAISCP